MNKPYLDLQDSRLMELYQKGDEKAFDLIYSRNKDKVYSYLKKRLYGQNEDLIEDVFQNIFIKLHKSRHLYKSELPYNKWLYTICRTVLIDSLKTNKLHTQEFKDLHFEYQNQDHQTIRQPVASAHTMAMVCAVIIAAASAHPTRMATSTAISREEMQ